MNRARDYVDDDLAMMLYIRYSRGITLHALSQQSDIPVATIRRAFVRRGWELHENPCDKPLEMKDTDPYAAYIKNLLRLAEEAK